LTRVQVIIPQIVYEYARSFVLVDAVGDLSHPEAVLQAVKQLMPHWRSLTDQLTSGQCCLFLLYIQ